MAIGIIVTILGIALPFIHFWMESDYIEIWKRIAETVIYGILFWVLLTLIFAVPIAVINHFDL